MEKVIIIKYGELSTKSDNINFFLKTLKNNVSAKLSGINHEIKYDHGRMIVYTEKIEEAIEKVKLVFGIHEICLGYKYQDKNINNILEKVYELVKDIDFNTFKIVTKRSDKNYPGTSTEISKQIGGYLLSRLSNKKVLMHDADLIINIEIRLTEVLIYFNGEKGLGGYPVSTLGKGLLMLSGGIDSPVAGYLAIKRGVRIEAIYFDSPPHTSPMALKKVEDLARILSKYNGEIRLHVINFTKIQEEIIKNIPNYYLITIMRRMMYQISAILASNINAHIIINGESIGQVASQTLKSMQVINEAIKLPVIRPVCTYDKLEIIDVAKKIGTYEKSIEPYEDCCTIFVPDHPVIHPDIKLVREYESLVDFKFLIFEAIKTRKIIKISEIEEKNYSDLL
ncbi:MAG: tRNA 4-thiouridine(8) synthase ThiI [Firmicutes bacterium]|nr:tRNA 4-thiouridine(8) synthase ThiI [Bacillota bacterium]